MAKKRSKKKSKKSAKKSSVRSMSPKGRVEVMPHVPADEVGEVVGGFVAEAASEVSAVREGASTLFTVTSKWT